MNPTAEKSGPEFNEQKIQSTRVFDIPRERVFGAFSNPEKLTRWWGPEGFTSTFREFDFQVGGFWRFTLHGPDGTDYVNEVRFLEIVPGERIVFEHLEPMHHFTMAMSFVDKDGGTLLTWEMTFNAPIQPGIRDFILVANQQNFDRLQANL